MVFLVGPRQVGKTTMSKSFLSEIIPGINYFNWDIRNHRKELITNIFQGKIDLKGIDKKIIVFDEIHKYPRWKNSIKGLFDSNEPDTHWIITGSAKLNVFRKGQDSLVGRSFTYHLAPFSLAELSNIKNKNHCMIERILKTEFSPSDKTSKEIFDYLLKFSGFPEPYLKRNIAFLNRWRSSRLERLINQDLAFTESLKNLPLVENLVFLLPGKVGSPLSINNLREDLEVHFSTAKHWLKLLERVFYVFPIYPYSRKSSRMMKKEQKWYLWDWTEISDPAIRFENLIAVHISKYVNYINDLGLDNLSLHYIRDKEKREVDFLICKKRNPVILIECKLKAGKIANSLLYYTKYLGVKRSIQLTAEFINPQKFKFHGFKVDLLPAASFLKILM